MWLWWGILMHAALRYRWVGGVREHVFHQLPVSILPALASPDQPDTAFISLYIPF